MADAQNQPIVKNRSEGQANKISRGYNTNHRGRGTGGIQS